MARSPRPNPRRPTVAAAPLERLEPRVHLSVARPSYNTGTGFFVSGGQVYDANGEAFVIRGVNQNHWWGNPAENFAAIDHVARTGSNAVRAVFNKDLPGITTQSGSDTPAERRAIVEEILSNSMVPIVEDHAVTNSTYVNDPNGLAQVVTNWLDPANVSWLQQYEQKLILNIANEWGPNSTSTNKVWRDTYITQVQRLRAANIDALIMIDAGGWGQDPNTIRNDAAAVLAADPQHNIVFSSHFYGNWRTEDRAFDVTANGPYDVLTHLTAVRNAGLPIVVGEFSYESLDFATYRTRRVMEICEQLDIGYMGWGWNHNSPTGLNMLVDVPGGSVDYQYNSNADLTAWGDLTVNDPDYGIKATAKRATVFPAEAPRMILEKTSVLVPETGHGLARVRLSQAPGADVTVNLSKLSGGDANLALAGATTLTFTPGNWDQYQTVAMFASADADTAAGTARFQLAAPGLQTVDFLARELDSGVAPGTFTLTPTQDRDTQSDSATGTNTAISASKWNYIHQKYDLSAVGGKVTNAVLRLYKTQTTSNLTGRVWLTLDDNWTQATAPASMPGLGYVVLSQAMPNAAGYVEFNVTGLVNGEVLGDRVASIGFTTSSDNWTSFNTREAAAQFRPQLVITSTEAVPPQVVSAAFDPEQNPNRLSFTFTENVAASLGTADVTLQSLSPGGAALTLSSPTYNAAAQTATFTVSPAVVPDGLYRATLNAPGVTDAASNAMVLGHTLDFFSLAGDATRDRTVNDADYAMWLANAGQPGGGFTRGDFNYDGAINAVDRDVLYAQFGKTLLPNPGSIAGTLFHDANSNGVTDPGEPGIAGRAVYLDVNGSGAQDPGEPSRTTDAQGRYAFDTLGPGNYAVRQVLPAGWTQTSPAGGAGLNVALAAGQALNNGNFGSAGQAAPRVTDLFVAGTGWEPGFLSHLAAASLGDGALGYAVPVADSLGILPWTNLNKFSVRFDRAVNVAAGHLTANGVAQPTYGVSAFAYDAATFTATWTLDTTGVAAEKLALHLAGHADAATGAPLGASHFRLNVLPADVNRSGGTVNAGDVTQVRNRQFTDTASGGLYSDFHDVNGNGVINAQDVTLTRNRQFTALPDGEPPAPAPVPSTATSAASAITSASPATASAPLALGDAARRRLVEDVLR